MFAETFSGIYKEGPCRLALTERINIFCGILGFIFLLGKILPKIWAYHIVCPACAP
jgi:hypothetical protein